MGGVEKQSKDGNTGSICDDPPPNNSHHRIIYCINMFGRDSGFHLHLPLLLGGFASQGTVCLFGKRKNDIHMISKETR